MKTHKLDDLLRTRFSREQVSRMRRKAKDEALTYTLKELRELAGKTQIETARAAEMTQSSLSELETREDHRLSTLRRYVEALGGELEVVAVFGHKRMRLQGI
jgi:DNA-binding XRE family transcriptional regulator